MAKNISLQWIIGFSFTALHYLSNYLLIIFSFPFLLPTIGIKNFGSFSFIFTLVNLLLIFVDYGLNTSSIKAVSTQTSTVHVNSVISKVYIIKSTLYFFCLVTTIFVTSISDSKLDLFGVYSGFFYLFGIINSPLWFFQAVQDLREITVINLLLKLTAIFFAVKVIAVVQNYYPFFLIIGVANIIVSLYSYYLLKTKFNFYFILPALQDIYFSLKSDFPTFLSNILGTIFLSANVFTLKFIISETELGLYSVSERVMYALWQILSVYSASIYPYLCVYFQYSNKSSSLRYSIHKTFPLFFGLIVLIAIVVSIFSDDIIRVITQSLHNGNITNSSNILRIMLISFTFAASNIIAHQALLATGHFKIVWLIFFFITILHFSLSYTMSLYWGGLGASVSFMISLFILSIILNLVAIKKVYGEFKL